MTCFAARSYVSSLPRPQRRWDPGRKVWLVDASLIAGLARDLRAAGFEVLVDGDQPDTWADQMFTALGADLGGQCYKALTRILHPDLIGDGSHMMALNCARDKARA